MGTWAGILIFDSWTVSCVINLWAWEKFMGMACHLIKTCEQLSACCGIMQGCGLQLSLSGELNQFFRVNYVQETFFLATTRFTNPTPETSLVICSKIWVSEIRQVCASTPPVTRVHSGSLWGLNCYSSYCGLHVHYVVNLLKGIIQPPCKSPSGTPLLSCLQK